MDTSAQRAAMTGRDLLRERPRRRSEPGRWTHHVADLNSGGVHTNALDRFPIQGPDREYTLDFTFDRQGMAPPEFVMTLEPGIDWMLFSSATLQTALLVTFPGVF